MRLTRPRLAALHLAFASVAAIATLGLMTASASASTQQLAMFQAGQELLSDPMGTLTQLQALGVGIVRVTVGWGAIAPQPRSTSAPSFNAIDPAQYPQSNWAPYDAVVRDARSLGIAVDLTVGGGAPLWAQGSGIPHGFASPVYAWRPSAVRFGQFVQAVGRRYSGSYTPAGSTTPLPRVSFWALWNEPDVGKNLAPQATNGSRVLSAPAMYRALVDSSWSALRATGHGRDTILIGSVAARGQSAPPGRGRPEGLPGNYGMTKPLQFIRALYCLDSRYRQLRGAAARATGCPTNAAGSRGFRSAHPGLFGASGFADHPYPESLPPTRATSNDPDFTEFSQLPNLERSLDRIQRTYGSGKRFPIYITEYGYITDPPNNSRTSTGSHFVSPATAALYINWAEYLSWQSPRIATTMQYLLDDPNPRVAVPEFGGFATGLRFFGGRAKPGLNAYRLPLFLPVTVTRRGRSLEVWGGVRPARVAQLATHRAQSVQIQFQRGSRGAFKTIRTVRITNPRGYFDVRIAFPASGSVRLSWSYRGTFSSRVVKVSVS